MNVFKLLNIFQLRIFHIFAMAVQAILFSIFIALSVNRELSNQKYLSNKVLNCLISSKESIVFVDHVNVNCNHQFINATFKVYNDGINPSLTEATFDVFADIAMIVISVKINIPENENDKNYGREFFKTSINLAKLFSGVQSSFVAKLFMETLVGRIAFDLKLPFKQVKLIL